MTTTTTPTLPRVECSKRSSSGVIPCYEPAVSVAVPGPASGYRAEPRALCGRHAAGAKRGWSVKGGYEVVRPMTDQERAAFLEAQEVRDGAKRAEAARRQAANEARVQERTAEAWDKLTRPYVATLYANVHDYYGTLEVGVVIHPADQSPEGSHWDSISVVLQDSKDGPAYVRLQAPAPTDLSPDAARVLAEILPLVTEWADALNAS